MIGQSQIIRARQQGLRPRTVFVEAGLAPLPQRFNFEKYENALAYGTHPTVNIPPDELGKRHDFRFLIGCVVIVTGECMSDDLLALGERIAEAGAKQVVVSSFRDSEILQYQNNEWEAWQ